MQLKANQAKRTSVYKKLNTDNTQAGLPLVCVRFVDRVFSYAHSQYDFILFVQEKFKLISLIVYRDNDVFQVCDLSILHFNTVKFCVQMIKK